MGRGSVGSADLVEVTVLESLEPRLAKNGEVVAPGGIGTIDIHTRVVEGEELSGNAQGSGAREGLADGNPLLRDDGRALA